MKKIKILMPLLSLSTLGSIIAPLTTLTSCGGGGSPGYEQINITVQTDDHCHANSQTAKVRKGASIYEIESTANITYDSGYTQSSVYLNEQAVDRSTIINNDATIKFTSVLESQKLSISFNYDNNRHYKYKDHEGGFSLECTRSMKWSEITKPEVICDDGYTFDNQWVCKGYGKINDDDVLGSISTSNFINIYPHIKSTNTVSPSNLTYTTNNNTATITGYSGSGLSHLNIPSTITDQQRTYTVTDIDFSYNDDIFEITLPNTVTKITDARLNNLVWINIPSSVKEIYNYAFSGLKCLESPVLQEGLQKIGDVAFQACRKIKNINIPKSLTSIGDCAFHYCDLSTITVDSENTVYTSKDASSKECNCLIKKSTNELLRGSGQMTIPSTITTIASWALTYLTELQSITFPASVTTINTTSDNPNPLLGCVNLASIKVDSNNSNYSSKDCTNNTECNILRKNDGYRIIISGCLGTTMPTDYSNYTVGSKAFANITKLTAIDLSHVESINESAFEGCSSLSSINLSSIDSNGLHKAAFKNCIGLTSISFSTSKHLVIPEQAFYGCANATVVSGSIFDCQSIGKEAFYGWEKLTNIVVPSTSELTTLSGFANCKNLTSIKIESIKVTSIGESAFEGCSSLVDVDFGKNSKVTSIGKSAFSNCSGLTTIVLPKTLTSIGDQAFNYANAITSLIIPNNVTTIGKSAFSGCSNLNFISFSDNLITIGDSAFEGCSSLTLVVLPNSVTTIGYDAFASCSKLQKLWIGIGLYSLGSSSRKSITGSCEALTEIYVDKSNPNFTSRDADGNECNYIANKPQSGETKYIYSTCTATNISSDIKGIYNYAFHNNHKDSIVIPSTIEYINDNAFYGVYASSITLQKSFPDWPSGFSNDAFSWLNKYEGTFNAPNSTVSSLVKQHWKEFVERNWKFNC